MMMPFKCISRFKIAFDLVRLSFNAFNTVLVCKKCINTNMLVEQCAPLHMFFGNDQCVRLSEHVR